MDNFVIGNMVWNAGLVTIIGFFAKHWINTTESNHKTAREDLAKQTVETAATIKEDQTASGIGCKEIR